MNRLKQLSKLSFLMAVILMVTACDFLTQTAEEKGKKLMESKLDLVKGAGDVLEDKGADTAETLTKGLGNVLAGAEKGIEKSSTKIALTPSIAESGLEVTSIQYASHQADSPPVLEAYVIANEPVDGKMKVFLFNVLDKEIGRTSVALKQDADDATYLSIPLDKKVHTGNIAKVQFAFKPTEVVAKK